MATWRRSQDSKAHVVIEGASMARCATKASDLGEPLLEAGHPICDECGSRVLHDANDAEASLAQLLPPSPASEDSNRRRGALGSLRALIQTVPTGPTTLLLTKAERLLESGDATGAHGLVKQWRANMVTAGLLPRD